MKKIFAPFVVLVFFYFTSSSQKLDITKLDSLMDVLETKGLANGSVAISLGGKIVYQKSLGFVSKENTNKPDEFTLYRIGSVSKMFTAVMILQMIDQGKLRLDDRLSRYFAQLPCAKEISIEQLLTHRTGLHDYTLDSDFSQWMDRNKSRQEMIELIAAKKCHFNPGDKAEYSNSNYLLLSYIIEDEMGMSYADALQKSIISKIGLTSTSFLDDTDSVLNLARSYKYKDKIWAPVKSTHPKLHLGAGSIISTPTDLVLFIQNLFSGKLISQVSLNNMTRMNEGYGMGIFPFNRKENYGYGHNGRIEEFYSAVRYYPDKNLGISYITNGILFPRTDILEGITRICFNECLEIPFSKDIKQADLNLQKYRGAYSSPDLPFKVFCRNEDGKLLFEFNGITMIVEPVTSRYFMHLASGSFFEFFPERNELQIKETDNVYSLRREN